MRILLLIWFLSTAVWCRSPEAVVTEVFASQQHNQNASKTVKDCAHCFTPGFLSLLQRAFGQDPRKGVYVDWNIFGNSQTGTGHYQVGRAFYDGAHSVVPVQVWTGLRSQQTTRDHKARANWKAIVTCHVHLTDVGAGWQIYDIQWLAQAARKDGKHGRPAIWVRKSLTPIAEGRWP